MIEQVQLHNQKARGKEGTGSLSELPAFILAIETVTYFLHLLSAIKCRQNVPCHYGAPSFTQLYPMVDRARNNQSAVWHLLSGTL